MATGDDIVAMARKKIAEGCTYGRPEPPDPKKRDLRSFDCSGFVNWVVGQFADEHATVGPNATAFAEYMYCLQNDRRNNGFTLEDGFKTPGALLFRARSPLKPEHIVISAGDRKSTLEAMGSAPDLGVREATNVTSRGWAGAVLIPGVDYPTIDAPATGPSGADRLLDTRTADGKGVAGGQPVSCRVRAGSTGAPPEATAVMLNVTAVNADSGYIAVAPTRAPFDAGRLSSNLNVGNEYRTMSGMVTVGIGPDDNVQLYTHARTDLVVHPLRWFTANDGLVPLKEPVRLYDTRPESRVAHVGGQPEPGIPLEVLINGNPLIADVTDAAAVVLTVTCANATLPGYVTVWPAGEAMPGTSNLNLSSASPIANQVIVRVGAEGKINLYSKFGTDVIVDIAAYFKAESAFRALSVPARLLDTRPSYKTGYSGDKLAAGDKIPFQVLGCGEVPAEGVKEVVLNVTSTESEAPGYVSIWPTGAPQRTWSILSVKTGQVLPNLTLVPVGADGTVTISTSSRAHLIADVFGYTTR